MTDRKCPVGLQMLCDFEVSIGKLYHHGLRCEACRLGGIFETLCELPAPPRFVDVDYDMSCSSTDDEEKDIDSSPSLSPSPLKREPMATIDGKPIMNESKRKRERKEKKEKKPKKEKKESVSNVKVEVKIEEGIEQPSDDNKEKEEDKPKTQRKRRNGWRVITEGGGEREYVTADDVSKALSVGRSRIFQAIKDTGDLMLPDRSIVKLQKLYTSKKEKENKES